MNAWAEMWVEVERSERGDEPLDHLIDDSPPSRCRRTDRLADEAEEAPWNEIRRVSEGEAECRTEGIRRSPPKYCVGVTVEVDAAAGAEVVKNSSTKERSEDSSTPVAATAMLAACPKVAVAKATVEA